MFKGILFTAASAVLYGSIGYFGVSLMQLGFSVSELLLWRFLFSLAILLPFVLKGFPEFRRSAVAPAILLKLFFFGAIFYGAGTAFYFEASKTIGTGLAMVIFFAYPIVVALLSTYLGKEPLSSLTLVSLALIVLGCSLIAVGESFVIDAKGIALAISSGIFYGAYVFFTKQVTRLVPPLVATFTVCAGAAMAFIVVQLWCTSGFSMPTSPIMWMHISLFSLLGTVLPVLFMLLGLRTISANKASIISVLEPVTVLAVGGLVLQEPVSALQLLGATIILSSSILVQFDKEKAVTTV